MYECRSLLFERSIVRANRLMPIFAAVLAFTDPASAQVLFGSIVGNVTDLSGAAVPGATVTVTQHETNEKRETKTSDAGGFTLSTVHAGTYKVEVSKAGFRGYIADNVVISINTVVRVDASLEVGMQSQSVEVSAESAVLQTDRADVHNEFSTKQLVDLPGYTSASSDWRQPVKSAAVCLLAWTMCVAQTDGPTLHGRVIGPDRKPVSGAMVSLKKARSNQALLSMTSSDGSYSFQKLTIGTDYELKAGHDGLSSVVGNLRVSNPDELVTIDLLLAPRIRFEDIAARAGLQFTLRNGATGHFYQPRNHARWSGGFRLQQ